MLRLLFLASIALAPCCTKSLLPQSSRLLRWAHPIAWTFTALSFALDLPLMSFAWLLFCLVCAGLFVFENRRTSITILCVEGVPFAFSVVGALWLVSAVNHFALLQYDELFSFYAALHSTVLGWMVIGTIAVLAKPRTPFQRYYRMAVALGFGSFFCIAFGIDQIPQLKPLGVLGITLVVGATQLLLLWESRRYRYVRWLVIASFLCFCFTIMLAWKHEWGQALSPAFFGIRPMVSVHGLVNVVFVAPTMMLAGYLRNRKLADSCRGKEK